MTLIMVLLVSMAKSTMIVRRQNRATLNMLLHEQEESDRRSFFNVVEDMNDIQYRRNFRISRGEVTLLLWLRIVDITNYKML